ncbi:WH1 domain protein [Dictyocaulus viviparus]|uniref:WH1 domain protein n=1 Tax=Dictyocaulus viviparus TaxID=29172 RepID=A0A0D8XR64_DICVI|nr:WH1 domain protein [Dictyocaulus viviparus]
MLEIVISLSESAMAAAAAEVMIYNESRKKWQAPSGVEGQISTVQILQNTARQTFRIIGIREQLRQLYDYEKYSIVSIKDGVWVLNCNIHHKLKYHTATPTFHQWRDEQRQVYGLNFSSEKEARDFVSAVGQAIDYLNHLFLHNGEYQVPNDNVYQDPHQHMMSHIQSAPSFRDQDDDGSQHLQTNSIHPSFRKSSHCVPINSTLNQQQRRSSQGSTSSSNGPCNYTQQQSASPSRNAPGPPVVPTSSASVSIPSCPPPAPPLPSVSGVPPAPPPPPPNLLKSERVKVTRCFLCVYYKELITDSDILRKNENKPNFSYFRSVVFLLSKMVTKNAGIEDWCGLLVYVVNRTANYADKFSLADQLRGAQLKKTNNTLREARSSSVVESSSLASSTNSSIPSSHGDLLSELAATFNKKKITQAKADAADSKSNASNGSSDSGCGTIPSVNGFAASAVGNTTRKWEPVKTNGNAESPKSHKKVPSGSSISSQEDAKSNGVPVVGNSITPDFLERFKAELMVEVRLEINKAKQEIIEVIRNELTRQ